MPIKVETGAGIEGANSFVSAEFCADFLEQRGLKFSDSPDGYEPFLFRAMDVLNGLKYRGKKESAVNDLPFPRKFIANAEGVPYPPCHVPNCMKLAQVMLAYHISEGDDPSEPMLPAAKKEKVDVLEIEYSTLDGHSMTGISIHQLPVVKQHIEHLLKSSNSGRVIRA